MAIKAYNAKLEYGDQDDYASSTAFTTVARCKSIKPPKKTAKDIDTTVLDSADEFEEMLPGLASGGDLEAQVEYDKTKVATLDGFFRVVKGWRVRYSDNSGWLFNGYISEIGDDEVVNGDIVRTSIKLKVTGRPVPSADLDA